MITTPKIWVLSFALGVLLFVSTISVATATVGGPTVIERLSYSASENAVYFTIHDQGGRGCPPEIAKLDLTTGEQSLVTTCEEIEQTYNTTGGMEQYQREIEDTFTALTPLANTSLQTIGVSVEVTYQSEVVDEQNPDNVSLNFRATVWQDEEEKGKFDFVGCYRDQPNVFGGYAISDSDQMVLLISRIGDCFEGGYNEDSVYLVGDIEWRDATSLIPHNAYSSPQINRGNVVATATEASVRPEGQETQTPLSSESTLVTTAQESASIETEAAESGVELETIAIYSVPASLFTLLLGYLLGKKSK